MSVINLIIKAFAFVATCVIVALLFVVRIITTLFKTVLNMPEDVERGVEIFRSMVD